MTGKRRAAGVSAGSHLFCLTHDGAGGFSLRAPQSSEIRVLVLQERSGEIERKGERISLHDKIAERITSGRWRRSVLFVGHAASRPL